MPSAEFEPATPATKRLQTYTLDRSATGIGNIFTIPPKSFYVFKLKNA
jgi:hypothetical protein